MSWGTIPSPVGGYDKATAVQGVMIETNRETKDAAVALLKSWYPLDPTKHANPPYPGPFRFVINRDNDRVKGNPVAMANLSIIMERQGIFNKHVRGEQTFCLKDLSRPYKPSVNTTVREKLLQTKISTLGDSLNGHPLFMSVSTAVNNRSGQHSVWFTFHKNVAAEAISVVQNLPSFIKEEWKVNPETLCYAQFTTNVDDWDQKLRVASNEDTEDIKLAAEIHTLDLKENDEPEPKIPDDDTLNTKAEREMNHMMNDTVTVTSISRPKPTNTTPDVIEVDSKSQGGISAVSSKSSAARARMQKEFDSKLAEQREIVHQLQAEKAAQDKETEKLKEQMEALKQMLLSINPAPTTPITNTPSHQPKSSHNSPHTSPTNEQKEEEMNPEFISHIEADYQDEIAQTAKTIIDSLNYKPSETELELIHEQAKELVDKEIVTAIPALPDTYADSDDSPKPNKPPEGRLTIKDSEDDEDKQDQHSPTLKRLRSSLSDEIDTESKMPRALQKYLQKNNNATGGKNPDEKN